MTRWFVAMLLVMSAFVLGDAVTPPASDQPATQPTTKPAAKRSEFPTAAELAEKILRLREQHNLLPDVAHIDLNAAVTERPADFSWFGEDDVQTLQVILQRIQQATDDPDIDAILLTLRSTALNLAQAQEVRAALARAVAADKKVYVYADAYDTISYTVATGASDICILAGGEIMIPGVGLEAMFARGLLDLVGVQADYVQIGEYKGADEQYTRTEPTAELRQELNKLSDALYAQIIDGISNHRALPAERVATLVDQALISSQAALESGLVDHLVDIDGLRQLIGQAFETSDINLVAHYGLPEREELDFSNIFALLAQLAHEVPPTDLPVIAVVYAEGMIIDGEGGDGLIGGRSVGSDDIRKAMRIVRRDENIRAVVIRIDSPGGSALASEAMWQAVRRAAAEKPVVVSIGSMAASGGYYLASASDHIIADPTAIVGSIGVVGGKFVLKDLYDKIGLSTESFVRGQNADLFSSTQPFTERQRQMVRNWMTSTYQQFTARILETRKDRIADIENVARGRVFLAQQARDLGLVDQLGGLHDAVLYAAAKAGLDGEEYDVQAIPEPITLADVLNGRPEAATPIRPRMSLAEDSILRAVAPEVRQLLGRQIQALQLLQQRPVVLVSPYIVRVR